MAKRYSSRDSTPGLSFKASVSDTKEYSPRQPMNLKKSSAQELAMLGRLVTISTLVKPNLPDQIVGGQGLADVGKGLRYEGGVGLLREGRGQG